MLRWSPSPHGPRAWPLQRPEFPSGGPAAPFGAHGAHPESDPGASRSEGRILPHRE